MKKLFAFAVLSFFMLVGINISYAEGLVNPTKLTWDPPTTNVDGSPLTDLAGYKLYFGHQKGIYNLIQADVGNVVIKNISELNLAEEQYYAIVIAYDTYGNESKYSNEVAFEIVIEPNSPTNFKAVQ